MRERILIIQENGRHGRNQSFRECFCLQRAFGELGIVADIWGLGHDNFNQPFNSIADRYSAILSLENYGNEWQPDYAKLKIPTAFWCIDAHMGVEPYVELARRSKFDIVFNSSEQYCCRFTGHCGESLWLPNAYDPFLIDRDEGVAKNVAVGFCGNVANRGEWINFLKKQPYGLRHDEMVIGPDMVRAINSYRIHWNRNIADDINYRTFETLGCGTLLLTNHTPNLERLFRVGEQLLTYCTPEDLIEKINFYMENPEESELIARAGYEHVRANHTYLQRVEAILAALGISDAQVRSAKREGEHLPLSIHKTSDPAKEISAMIESADSLIMSGEWLGQVAELGQGRPPRNGDDFGGSSIESPLFAWVLNNLPPGSTILELGSGSGSTKNFSRFYKMISVEDKREFVGLYKSRYIHAPIRDGWYDLQVLRQELPDHYDLILVDGPTGEGNRWGFYQNLGLFDTSVPIVFDDILRKAELEMMYKVGSALGKRPLVNDINDNFGVIL